MKFIAFLLFYVILEQGQAKTFTSLTVTEADEEFELTKPYGYENEKEIYLMAPKYGQTHCLCPKTEVEDNAKKTEMEMKSLTFSNNDSDIENILKKTLYSVKQFKRSQRFHEQKICSQLVEPIFIKVQNPEELKNNWDSANMELYHSGFLLDVNNMREKSPPSPRTKEITKKPKPIYDLDDRYNLVLGIEVHYNKVIQRAVAVQYKLLSTAVFEEDDAQEFKFVGPNGSSDFKQYSSNDNDVKFIESKTGVPFENYYQKRGKNNLIYEMPFAPVQHLQLSIWRKTAEISINKTPMWYPVVLNWEKAMTFSRIVATYLGDLEVTAGITGVMSLTKPNESANLSNSNSLPQILLEDTNFKIPNYFWKAFEFKEKDVWYGIFVILHCNTFEDNTKNICDDICGQNDWLISNQNFKFGKIYCCEMTNKNIELLEANFLLKKTRKIFDLKIWKEKKEEILNEFNSFYKNTEY